MNSPYLKPVLILDANQRSTLAVTRSLGRHGVSLIIADEIVTSLPGCSRPSRKYYLYPLPRLLTEHFISTIAEICNKENIDIIFPMTELTTNMPLKHRTNSHGLSYHLQISKRQMRWQINTGDVTGSSPRYTGAENCVRRRAEQFAGEAKSIELSGSAQSRKVVALISA